MIIFIISAALLWLLSINYKHIKGGFVVWEFPLVGVLPTILFNLDRMNDKIYEVLEASGGTIVGKSLATDMLFTSDPSNVQYVMSSNFSSYHKGEEWRKRFDIFGNFVFNSDSDEWHSKRKRIRSFVSHQEFNRRISRISLRVISESLVSFLDQVCKKELVVDLQDVFHRLVFDIACDIIAGHESNSLGLGIPRPPFLEKLDDAAEAILVRYWIPESIWKLQRWLRIGKENKLERAWNTLDKIFEEYISAKRDNLNTYETGSDVGFNLLELSLTDHPIYGPGPHTYKSIRDDVIGLVMAISDTTVSSLAWFFWMLSNNPLIESKIREELSNISTYTNVEELGKLVYLQAALLETLRLYPAAPFNIRMPTQSDTLPSGHKVTKNTMVIISGYAMGRMRSVWGHDSHVYKPERWITKDGKIKYEPTNKFYAFSTGPRICPGKDFAFTLMKTIVGTVLSNFQVHIIKDHHPVTYKASVFLQMKHPLAAKINRI